MGSGRGSGRGSCLSSEPSNVADPQQAQVNSTPPPGPAPAPAPASKMTVKIGVIFYSMYGHIYKLAQSVKQGIDSVEGVEGILYQVAETLPEEVLGMMHAAPKPDVPLITANQLTDFDGFVFGTPTRFASPSAQFKQFWDSTGQLWQKGLLYGKPFGMFISTATQGGGQEMTIAGALGNFVNHGMIFVPPGTAAGPEMYSNEAVRGGGPWGAGTFAGADGMRQPTKFELEAAVYQGKHMAEVTKKLAA